jgi:hypothetical protein
MKEEDKLEKDMTPEPTSIPDIYSMREQILLLTERRTHDAGHIDDIIEYMNEHRKSTLESNTKITDVLTELRIGQVKMVSEIEVLTKDFSSFRQFWRYVGYTITALFITTIGAWILRGGLHLM